MPNGERCSGGSFMVGMLVGGLVGAGLALLYAPSSGAETRARIREMGGDLKDGAAEYYDRGKCYVGNRKSAISSAVEAGVEAYKREVEKSEGPKETQA